jgi:hypothetical protein
LTPSEYAALVAQPCWYCGGPLPEYGYGLDRIDETAGYEASNVLPCCRWCNTYRRGWIKPAEWRAAIVEHERRSGRQFRWGEYGGTRAARGLRTVDTSLPNVIGQVHEIRKVLMELAAGRDRRQQKLWALRRKLELWERVAVIAQTDEWRQIYADRVDEYKRKIEDVSHQLVVGPLT